MPFTHERLRLAFKGTRVTLQNAIILLKGTLHSLQQHYLIVYRLQLMFCVFMVLRIHSSVLCIYCPRVLARYVVLHTVMCCIVVLPYREMVINLDVYFNTSMHEMCKEMCKAFPTRGSVQMED